MIEEFTLIERLRTRASIRRNIQTRKSVQEGKPDRIADLLDEAADEIEDQWESIQHMEDVIEKLHDALETEEGRLRFMKERDAYDKELIEGF